MVREGRHSISRHDKQHRITWRRWRKIKTSHPILTRILVTILVIELGIFTLRYEQSSLPFIVFGEEDAARMSDTEVHKRIFIRIYYE